MSATSAVLRQLALTCKDANNVVKVRKERYLKTGDKYYKDYSEGTCVADDLDYTVTPPRKFSN